jgi:ATP-dependent Lon protease
VDDPDPGLPAPSRLVPVLALADGCLFPGGSRSLVVSHPASVAAVRMAARTGGVLLVVARRERGTGPRDVHSIGTLAGLRDTRELAPHELHVELDARERARIDTLVGTDLLVAQVSVVPDGDEGDEWGPAVEALARYLHGHADLRSFLEGQRRSGDPMSWVNLACQHLPITASAQQRLLDATAAERCAKIARGLDALLRKEKG